MGAVLLCPTCDGDLVVRTNSHTGVKFWGCSQYPKCRYTQDDHSLNDFAEGDLVLVNTRSSGISGGGRPACNVWELATVLESDDGRLVVSLLRADYRNVPSGVWGGISANVWFVEADDSRWPRENTMAKYKVGEVVQVHTGLSSIAKALGEAFILEWEPATVTKAIDHGYTITLGSVEGLWLAREEWLRPLGETQMAEEKKVVEKKTKTAASPKEQLKSLGAVVGAGVAMGATDKVGDVFIRMARKLSKNSPLIEALLDDYLGREIVKLLIAGSLRTTALSAPQLVPGSEHIAAAADLQITFSAAKLSSAGLDLLGEELQLLAQVGKSLALPAATEAEVVELGELREERATSRRGGR